MNEIINKDRKVIIMDIISIPLNDSPETQRSTSCVIVGCGLVLVLVGMIDVGSGV